MYDRRDDTDFLRWAKAVKVRDNFTCFICDKRGVKLESHHKNSWDWCEEQRYDIDNGVTLCTYHHEMFHNIFGFGQNHDYQFEQYLDICETFSKILSSKYGTDPFKIE